MRFDYLSGWQLFAVQIVALIVVTAMLWAVGLAFQRSRLARWLSLLAAAAAGAAIAVGLLRSDESVVSSYLFAACLFMLGTVVMSVFLLAAIPQTSHAALGSAVAGAVLLITFVLVYYAAFNFGLPRWIQRPPGPLAVSSAPNDPNDPND